MLLAYIDPGLGIAFLQILIASVIGTLVIFRRTLKRFFGMILGSSKKDRPPSPGSPNP